MLMHKFIRMRPTNRGYIRNVTESKMKLNYYKFVNNKKIKLSKKTISIYNKKLMDSKLTKIPILSQNL